MTREQFERELDTGHVYAVMNNGRQWQARRNGATKLWKTRPGEFRIPVKAGLRATGYADHHNYNDPYYFVIREG